MKTFVLGLTFLVISAPVSARLDIIIENPVGQRPDGTIGPIKFDGPITITSGLPADAYNAKTQLGDQVNKVTTDGQVEADVSTHDPNHTHCNHAPNMTSGGMPEFGVRMPASAQESPQGPVRYNPMDFVHRAGGEFKQP